MGLFIKFRRNLKRRKRRIFAVDLKKIAEKNKKNNNSSFIHNSIDNDEDFVLNIDDLFINKQEVTKNKYSDWMKKNFDLEMSSENNCFSNDKSTSKIPKDSIMNSIPFDVFGNRKVYSSFHNTPTPINAYNDIATNFNNETINVHEEKKEYEKEPITEEKGINSDDSHINELTNILNKKDDNKSNNHDYKLSVKIKESYIDKNNRNNDFTNIELSSNDFDFKKFNEDSLINENINNKINEQEHLNDSHIEDIVFDLDIDEGQKSIERKIDEDKSIVLNQGFVQNPLKRTENINNKTNTKSNFQNKISFPVANEIANKLNKNSNISKLDTAVFKEQQDENLRNITGKVLTFVEKKINKENENSFRIFLDDNKSYQRCRVNGSLFKKISLEDFKSDPNFKQIDKKFQEIYRFKNDDSVKGYIGELIFYKIMTQKDDAGLPVFNELISTFFEKLPDRFFKYKKNSDLLTVDWKSLGNRKSDADFCISFTNEENDTKLKSAYKSWNCEIKSTNKKFSRIKRKNNIKLSGEQIKNFLDNSIWQIFKIHGVNYNIEKNVLTHKFDKPCIDVIKIVRSNFIEMAHKQLEEGKLFNQKKKNNL